MTSILGALFGVSSWTSAKPKLMILVATLVNPNAPPPHSVLRIVPDTSLPARDAIEKRATAEANRVDQTQSSHHGDAFGGSFGR
jgi:hypothetical protein